MEDFCFQYRMSGYLKLELNVYICAEKKINLSDRPIAIRSQQQRKYNKKKIQCQCINYVSNGHINLIKFLYIVENRPLERRTETKTSFLC